MKKSTLVVVPLLLLGLLGTGYFVFLWPLDHVAFSRAKSPSGEFTAASYLTAEGGTPPYGVEVIIYKTKFPWTKYLASPVFGGYCEKESLAWESDGRLVINCVEPSKISIKDHGPYDVEIILKNINAKQDLPADTSAASPLQRL